MKKVLWLTALLLCLASLAAAEGVSVVNVDATSWIEGKDPSAYVPYRMIDGVETTAFQFSTKTTPLGKAYVYFYLAAPSEISALWIKNGFWKITDGLDQYTRNSRVKVMTVDFQYEGSTQYRDPKTVTLPDDKSRQDWTRVDLGSHQNVVSVRFLIKSIYQGSKYKNDVCISEVRFVGSGTAPSTVPTGALYGLAKQKLATRDGPGTTYNEKGTYNVAGQYIRVLSRAWDARNGIWWVKCEIPYRNEIRVLWTGYKRFDPATLPLESIPIEGQGGSGYLPTVPPSRPTAMPGPTAMPLGTDWNSVFRAFVMNGQYRYAEVSFDTSSDILFTLYDMDRDGTPELIASNGDMSMAGRTNYVFVCADGRAEYAGDVGFRDSVLTYYPGSAYPGLFCQDGNMGYYATEYYSLVHGSAINQEDVVEYIYVPEDDPYGWLDEPIVQQRTADDALFALAAGGGGVALDMYTLSEINAIGGWEAFVQKLTAPAASAPAPWQDLYRAFVTSGQYRAYLFNPTPEYHQLLAARDPGYDFFAVHDVDRDGTPELLVQTVYGLEQTDVFTVRGGQVVHLGMIGGDNFFQDIVWFDSAAYPGLFSLMGGPVMTIDRYTVNAGVLRRTAIGRTIVNSEGDATVGVQMDTNDATLYRLLYEDLVLGQEHGHTLLWTILNNLKTDTNWIAFWLTLQTPYTAGAPKF